MAFDLLALQDGITARTKVVLPGHEVMEDGILDDANLPRDPGSQQVIPFIIIRYGPLRRKYLGHAVAGARHDDYYSTVDFLVVGPTGRIARQGLNILTDAYIGYKPDGTSEMIIEGGTSEFVIMSNEARPTAFVSTIRFRFGVNGENVAAHLTPQ